MYESFVEDKAKVAGTDWAFYNLSYCFDVCSSFANERTTLIAWYYQPQRYELPSCDIQLHL